MRQEGFTKEVKIFNKMVLRDVIKRNILEESIRIKETAQIKSTISNIYLTSLGISPILFDATEELLREISNEHWFIELVNNVAGTKVNMPIVSCDFNEERKMMDINLLFATPEKQYQSKLLHWIE